MHKKIAIVGTNGLPGRYGGWDQLVHHLTKNLQNEFKFIVYTSKYDALPNTDIINGALIKKVPFKANGFQSIPYDIFSMIHAINKTDIIYLCGVSGCIFLPFLKFFKVKIILNPDGQEWRRNKFSSLIKKFLKFSEKVGVRYSDLVIADNIEIANYLSKEYNINSTVIEYGGDHVSKNRSLQLIYQKKFSIKPNKYAFKVCRIEPENNIELILKAFLNLSMTLVMIGNWDNSKFGKELKKKYGIQSNYELLDPIYDQKELDSLRNNCLIYIHGHSAGGTNPSLVEAMSLGLCVIAYDVSFNRETTENKSLYFKTVKDLTDLIELILEKESMIDKYKMNMLEIAKRRYTWDIITNKYSYVFKNI